VCHTTMLIIIKYASFVLFAVSTPIALWRVMLVGDDALIWSVINSYGFSIGMIGIYDTFIHSLTPVVVHGVHDWIKQL